MTHASTRVSGLRSVALTVPDLAAAETFYTEVWHLSVAARTANALYLRGTGADHHLLALHQADGPAAIRHVTLRARSREALDEVARLAPTHGGRLLADGSVDEPGGGRAVTVADGDGRAYRVVWGDERHADAHERRDHPVRLAHAVLNSHDLDRARSFLEQVLDFSLADRTRIMAFMRCGSDHHSIALGDTDNDALNHIAFLMPDLDSVMRGGGRMKDAGYGIQWGPGRHGPGNNLFAFIADPDGNWIEISAELETVDDRPPRCWPHEEHTMNLWGRGILRA